MCLLIHCVTLLICPQFLCVLLLILRRKLDLCAVSLMCLLILCVTLLILCVTLLILCVTLLILLRIPYCGVATISRLLEITGLFCKRAL